jgi:hypothetical protein
VLVSSSPAMVTFVHADIESTSTPSFRETSIPINSTCQKQEAVDVEVAHVSDLTAPDSVLIALTLNMSILSCLLQIGRISVSA